MKFSVVVPLTVLLLIACSSENIQRFSSGQPSMAPNIWMVGDVEGYGVIRDRFGTVKSQFHIREVGNWDPATRTVTLVEHTVYLQSSSKPSDRIWHFVESSPGSWTGTAADVIGTATGEQQGNAWHLIFRQTIPVGGHQVEVTVNDWRLREGDTVAIDHSTLTKLGVELASAEIAFVKTP